MYKIFKRFFDILLSGIARLAGLDHFRCRFATPRGDVEVAMDKNNPKPEIILPDSIESTNLEE